METELSSDVIACNKLVTAQVILMVTYVVTTLCQGLFGSVPINRLLGFMIVAVLTLHFSLSRRSRMQYFAIAILGLLSARSFVNASSISIELSDWVYLTSTFLLILQVLDSRSRDQIFDALERLRLFIGICILFSVVLLTGLLITKTGFVYAWGEDPYFKGLCNSEHTLASICTMLLVLLYYLMQTGKSKFIYILPFGLVLYALLQTGARTYLVPAGICSLLFIKAIGSKKWIRAMICVLFFTVVVYVFSTSGMANKFEFTRTNQYAESLLSALTNGRNEIWGADLNVWSKSGPIGVLLGNSFSNVYVVNERLLTLFIWAHNDLVMVLFSIGVAGLIIYLSTIGALIKNMKGTLKKGTFILLVTFMLFPMLLNGFYPYQHLVYAFILLFVICSNGKIKNERLNDGIE